MSELITNQGAGDVSNAAFDEAKVVGEFMYQVEGRLAKIEATREVVEKMELEEAIARLGILVPCLWSFRQSPLVELADGRILVDTDTACGEDGVWVRETLQNKIASALGGFSLLVLGIMWIFKAIILGSVDWAVDFGIYLLVLVAITAGILWCIMDLQIGHGERWVRVEGDKRIAGKIETTLRRLTGEIGLEVPGAIEPKS